MHACMHTLFAIMPTNVATVCIYTHVHSYSVCLEQWIRAKYERKEFAPESDMSKTPYTAGGWVWTCVGLIIA